MKKIVISILFFLSFFIFAASTGNVKTVLAVVDCSACTYGCNDAGTACRGAPGFCPPGYHYDEAYNDCVINGGGGGGNGGDGGGTTAPPYCGVVVSGNAIAYSGANVPAGTNIKLWVARTDKAAIDPAPPNGYVYYENGEVGPYTGYLVSSCDTDAQGSCYGTFDVSSLHVGDYYFHCDIQNISGKCSGQPFCNYENPPMPGGINCSASGYSSCSVYDNLTYTRVDSRPALCASTTASASTLPYGGSLTITSTANVSNITNFIFGFYNMDNLYGQDNAKPIYFTANTGYVRSDTANTITVTYDELNKPDLNWGGGIPTNISVSGYFANNLGEWSAPGAQCVTRFNIDRTAPTATPTITPMATLTPVPGCANKSRGDANCDGTVNLLDYFYYVQKVSGGSVPTSVNADFNVSGAVDGVDRGIIIHTLLGN